MTGTVSCEKFGDHLIFILNGYVEKECADLILKHYQVEKANGVHFFIFDFSQVTLINSLALGVFLDLVSDTIGDEDINFYFCAIPKSCYYGMSAVGLTNCATEFDSLDQAKKELELT